MTNINMWTKQNKTDGIQAAFFNGDGFVPTENIWGKQQQCPMYVYSHGPTRRKLRKG
jgi:hypothetical protein